MESRVKSSLKKKKNVVGNTPAESYLYSKVLPRRLRATTLAPPGTSPAGASPACAGQASCPESASSSAIPQPALLNRTGSVSSLSNRSASSVTLSRRPSAPSVSKQTITSSLSVTAELKQSGVPGGAGPWQQRPRLGERPAERQGDAAACTSKTPKGQTDQRKNNLHGQATAGSQMWTNCGRSTSPKDASKDFSLTEHRSVVGKESMEMENKEDDGYCALKRNSTLSAGDLQQGGSQTWNLDRRRHKEDWCPFSLKDRRRQYSEGNISPTGGIWRDVRRHFPGSSDPTPSQQQPDQTPAPDSVPDTRQMQRGVNNLITSVPADYVFRHAGRSMTMEEACQLVFPSAASGPGQTGSFENANGGTDTDSGNRDGDRSKSSQTEKGSVSESVESFGQPPHSTSRSAGGKLGTTQTGVIPSTSSGTNSVTSSAFSNKDTEGRSAPEGAGIEENTQKHQAKNKRQTSEHTMGSLPPPDLHTTPDNASSPHDTSTLKTESSAMGEELQAVSILQACSACQTACPDVRVMHCFHILCHQCIKAGDDAESLQCGLCGAQQTLPQKGLPLLRDLFPGLFDMLSALHDSMSLTPHTLEDNLRRRDTAQAGNLRAQRDVEADRMPTASPTSTLAAGGSVSGISHHATLECSNRLPTKQSPVKKTEQSPSDTPTTQDSRQKKEVKTDKGDIDDANNDSTTSLSDNSDDACNKRVTNTWDLNNPPSRSQDAAATKPSSKDQIPVTPLSQQSRLCGACHVHADLQHACVTCGGIGLCAGCHVAHLRLPVTRSHEVVRMSLSQAPLSPLTLLGHHQPLCALHGQDLALQCRTCAQLLCHRCLTPQHAGHAVQELGQLQHASHKQFTILKRGIKQHLLTARSSARAVTQQLDKVTASRQKVRQAIHDFARQHLQKLTIQTQQLTQDVETSTQGALRRLTASELNLRHVRQRGERLGCLLNAVTEDTPRLTQLILQTTCQAWFDQLRQQRSLHVEEVEDVAFRPDLTLEDHLDAPPTLGRVCTLATSIPDTTVRIRAVFQTPGEITALAFTPYREVVCASSHADTCKVWNSHGTMLVDVSHQVTQPSEVKVTPSGILVIMGTDQSQPGRKACVTFLSPSGSLLAKVLLTSSLQHTHMDCPTHSRLLISDGEKKTITLYGLNLQAENPTLTLLRQVCHPALVHPHHVTITVAGDWLVNDQGYFVKAVSPEDHVTTVLTEDEPEAVLQPPRSTRPRCCKRMLTGICCDARGYIMSVDSGKNGLYLITSGSQGGAERHFVSLQELTASCHVTAMAVNRDDEIVLGMSDGTVCFLTIGLEEEVEEIPGDAPF